MNDEDGIYSLADAGRALVHSRKRSEGWMSVRHRIEKRLAATTDGDGPNFEDARFPYPAVTDEVVDDAVMQYHARFARLLAELKKRDRKK